MQEGRYLLMSSCACVYIAVEVSGAAQEEKAELLQQRGSSVCSKLQHCSRAWTLSLRNHAYLPLNTTPPVVSRTTQSQLLSEPLVHISLVAYVDLSCEIDLRALLITFQLHHSSQCAIHIRLFA